MDMCVALDNGHTASRQKDLDLFVDVFDRARQALFF